MARIHFHSKVRSAYGRSFAANPVDLAKRCSLFAKFPIGSEITYRWEKGLLGRVVSHDHTKGRVITNNGGSHSTLDVEVFVPDEK